MARDLPSASSNDEATGASRRGPLAAEITTEIVRLHARTHGRGPRHARTVLSEDLVVTILHGGYTDAEHALLKTGHAEVVRAGRVAMQQVMAAEMRATVERLTRQRVLAVLSATHGSPDVSVETFVLGAEVSAPSADPGTTALPSTT